MCDRLRIGHPCGPAALPCDSYGGHISAFAIAKDLAAGLPIIFTQFSCLRPRPYNTITRITCWNLPTKGNEMHKVHCIVLFALLLSGCSYTDLLSLAPTRISAAPSATATLYRTPTQTASITPTQPTPTFTSTPTLIYPNGTPLPSPTVTVSPTLSDLRYWHCYRADAAAAGQRPIFDHLNVR